MGLKQEEMLSRYFEHRMSSGEEQNFLISLAASDELRIAFRSHLELMKAVRDDKDDLRSVAQVRNRTFAALGLSAAAVTPFIEQELVRSAKAAAEKEQAAATWSSRLGKLFQTRKFALGSGLMLGFSAATMVMMLAGSPSVNPERAGSAQAPVQTQSAPPSTTRQWAPQQVSPGQRVANQSDAVPADKAVTSKQSRTEPIHASKGLNSMAQPAKHTASAGVQSSPVDVSKASTSTPPPTVTSSRPGTMHAPPATILRPKDSATAK